MKKNDLISILNSFPGNPEIVVCSTPRCTNWCSNFSLEIGKVEDGSIALSLEEYSTTEKEPKITWGHMEEGDD